MSVKFLNRSQFEKNETADETAVGTIVETAGETLKKII